MTDLSCRDQESAIKRLAPMVLALAFGSIGCSPRAPRDHGHGHDHDQAGDVDAPGEAHVELSLEGAQAAGVRVAPLERRVVDGARRFPAEVRVEAHGVAHLAPIAPGRVERVHVRLGQAVRAGEALVTLDSAGVADLRARERALEAPLRAAEAALARRTQLAAEGIGAERAVQEAESEVARLRAEVAGLRRQATALGARAGSVAMRAPFAGVITRLDVTAGEPAAPDTPALTLVDPTAVAVFVAIPERALRHLDLAAAPHDGARVRFRAHALAGAIEGHVTYVSPTLDPATRTLLARVMLDVTAARAADAAPLAALRGGMFGEVELVDDPAQVLALPVDAIAYVGGVPTAFVRTSGATDDPLRFEPHPVTLGRRADGFVEVQSGLEEGADVAHAGAFVLEGILRAHLIPEDHDH
ncbi:MAG: efflux RND transporter periplasmic adaptor subunit [Myxococcales bacterium]|nr:efflux RND transporter periplasmic adaptor subunit [Myxococcales bacterium]